MSTLEEVRIDLVRVSQEPSVSRFTALTMPRLLRMSSIIAVQVAVQVAAVPASHAVGVQPIFPLPDFSDFLIAVLVLSVAVWSGWIIDVIPVLRRQLLFLVLLALLSSAARTIVCSVKPVDIVIVPGPISNGGLHQRLPRRSTWSGSGAGCVRSARGSRRQGSFREGRPRFCLLGWQLWSFGGLES